MWPSAVRYTPKGADSHAPATPASLRCQRSGRFRNAASSWHWRAIAVLNRLTSILCPSPLLARWKRPTIAENANISAVLASTIELPDGVGGSPRRPP